MNSRAIQLLGSVTQTALKGKSEDGIGDQKAVDRFLLVVIAGQNDRSRCKAVVRVLARQ